MCTPYEHTQTLNTHNTKYTQQIHRRTHAIQSRTAWKTCMWQAAGQAVCSLGKALILNLLVKFSHWECNRRVLEPIAGWESVQFTLGEELIFWVKSVCFVWADLPCLSDSCLFKDLLQWRWESTADNFWRRACDAPELWFGLNWQISIERCFAISNHAFNGSTVEQQM